MKIGRRRREEAEVESSALNDIMFFLLLFFLIASTLANPNVINVLLPKAKTTSKIQTKPMILTVKRPDGAVIGEDGTGPVVYYIDNNKEPVEVDELEQVMLERDKEFYDPNNPDSRLSVVLRLDKKLTIQEVVDVMQIGANQGIRMVLATDKKQ